MVAKFFFGKGYVRKRAKRKTMTVLGVFEFDAFLSCVFRFLKRKGEWGRKPRPKDKRSNVMSEMLLLLLLLLLFGCFVIVDVYRCFCFVLFLLVFLLFF